MKTSIIIPTFNGAHKILNVLRAIEKQCIKELEVIVVIDGSTDNTKVLLESTHFSLPDLVILEQPNGGRSISRNIGARRAQGDLLIFFDDDMRPEKDCVSHHIIHHAKNPGSIMVGSAIEDWQVLKTDFQFYKGYLSRLWQEPLIQNQGIITKKNLFLTAANFSISKDLFNALNGFDEQLNDAEDFDLGVRAVLGSVPIYFDHHAIGWHDDLITCQSYINRQIQYRKAHDILKQLKPDLYKDFNNHQLEIPGGFKKLFFYFFSFSFWVRSIDSFNWLLIFPKFIRYRIYSYVTTSRSQYFSNKL